MPRFNITFDIEGATQTIVPTSGRKIRAGSRNYWYAVFTFLDDAFNDLDYLTATFSTSPYSKKRELVKTMPIENGECQIPPEVLTKKGKVYVGISAGDMMVTNEAVVEVTEAAPTIGSESIPTEPWYERFVNKLDFIATYDETSWAEIEQAHRDGRMIWLKIPDYFEDKPLEPAEPGILANSDPDPDPNSGRGLELEIKKDDEKESEVSREYYVPMVEFSSFNNYARFVVIRSSGEVIDEYFVEKIIHDDESETFDPGEGDDDVLEQKGIKELTRDKDNGISKIDCHWEHNIISLYDNFNNLFIFNYENISYQEVNEAINLNKMCILRYYDGVDIEYATFIRRHTDIFADNYNLYFGNSEHIFSIHYFYSLKAGDWVTNWFIEPVQAVPQADHEGQFFISDENGNGYWADIEAWYGGRY